MRVVYDGYEHTYPFTFLSSKITLSPNSHLKTKFNSTSSSLTIFNANFVSRVDQGKKILLGTKKSKWNETNKAKEHSTQEDARSKVQVSSLRANSLDEGKNVNFYF